VRQQQDERNVRPPNGRDPDREADHVGDARADHNDGRHPPTEPAMQIDHPRRDADDHEVDGKEPERPERQGGPGREERAKERRSVPDPRTRGRSDVEQVHPDDHRAPDREEHERGPQQPHHPGLHEAPVGIASSSRRLEGDEVREPTDEEEDRHHLEEPRR